jgi:hypothetical protein
VQSRWFRLEWPGLLQNGQIISSGTDNMMSSGACEGVGVSEFIFWIIKMNVYDIKNSDNFFLLKTNFFFTGDSAGL